MLYRLYAFFGTFFRTNRFIHRVIFGYYPLRNSNGLYWDWTTLSLRLVLPRYVNTNTRLLDVGTGPVGVLAIFAYLSLGCKSVHAIDRFDHLLREAHKNARYQGAVIRFYKSDLFSEVREAFDCIVFNTPYIDRDRGVRRGILPDDESIARLCGGDNGCDTIDLFLKAASSFLTERGVVILGVNHHYVAPALMVAAIARSGFLLVNVSSNWLSGGSAYILRRCL